MASDRASSLGIWPVGGGETGALIRRRDWSATPLGNIGQWPERLRAAVDNCLDAAFASFVWWGPELVQLYNDPALSIVRGRHPAAFGVPAREAWPDAWASVGPVAASVMSTGRPVLGENLPLAPDRDPREAACISLSCSALRDVTGAVGGVLVTAFKTAETGRAELEERYRAVFEAMDEGYLLVDVIFDDAGRAVDLEFVEANPAAIRMMGDDMTGRRVSESGVDYEPYWYEVWGRVARTGRGERLQRYAVSLKRWFDFFVFKTVPHDDESRRVAVLFHDVTGEKVTSERVGVMVAELQHRTRNLIAVVRSIISHTLVSSPSPDEFRLRIDDRLSALSRVQGLLSRSAQEPITIGALVRLEFDTLSPGLPRERVDIAGPEVRLRSSIVQTLALALHELAVNTRKHGALLTDQGRLRIAWQPEQRGEAPWLLLNWVEENVRSAGSQPDHRGYGRELVECALPYSLGAETRYDLDETGLRCTIALPLGTDGRQEPRP